MPGQLAADRVGYGSDKFTAETEFGAEFQGKLFGVVFFFRHVPLDLRMDKKSFGVQNRKLSKQNFDAKIIIQWYEQILDSKIRNRWIKVLLPKILKKVYLISVQNKMLQYLKKIIDATEIKHTTYKV